MTPAPATVVVVAGGPSTRFGADKLGAPLRGTTVLDHLLADLPPDWPVVVVGAERPTTRPVSWTREEPPGGGPLAGIAAGLALVGTPIAGVVAGDMPYAATALAAVVHVLTGAPADVCAVVATDHEGVPNPLLAAYRTEAARAAVPGSGHGHPARTLLDLPHVTVPVTTVASRDVDTPADLDELAAAPEGDGTARR
jgi:molybdopterin-guanine dinucleotide biosynthesis protein A